MIPTETWVLPRPRKNRYRGGFPLHFEKKLHRLLGEPETVLHPFGGQAEIGDRVDLNAATGPRWIGDAHCMDFIADEAYDLVVLDPPYSDEESKELYGTPKLHFKKYISEAVRVCKPGGHVAVYHYWPTSRPEGTRLVQRIVVLTRTWHRPRVCQVFRKEERE